MFHTQPENKRTLEYIFIKIKVYLKKTIVAFTIINSPIHGSGNFHRKNVFFHNQIILILKTSFIIQNKMSN